MESDAEWVELTCPATGEARLINLANVEQIEPEKPTLRGANTLFRYVSGHEQAVTQHYAEVRALVHGRG